MIAAIGEYNELKRELTKASVKEEMQKPQQPTDLEKGKLSPPKEEEFNLDDFLQSVAVRWEEAGKVPKKLGLIWKDLHVEVCIHVLRPQPEKTLTHMALHINRELVQMHIRFPLC